MLASNKTTRNTSKALGDLLSFSKTEHGMRGITSCGNFDITVFSASTIRIRATQNEQFSDFSFAVVVPPQPTDFSFSDSENEIEIATTKTKLKIQKSPVRFCFLTTEDDIINQDDEGFGTSWIGEQVTTYKKMQEGERFIGLGEKTGPLDRAGNAYQHWNTDSFAYSTSEDPLYCSTPFYIGLHHGLAYGVFFDNSHKSHFNFGASNNRFSSFSADSGDMNYYFIHETDVAGIIKSYSLLTGTMELPPLWSIGYQQCRYSYYPDTEVLNVAKTFRDKKIPADVIVLDIHYMDAYKIFTWHKDYFKNPKQLVDNLTELGFDVVVMCDPGIKIEEGYAPYDDGKKEDVFLKYPDGTYYSGQVWPGWCHFPDFTIQKTREWWAKKFDTYTSLGIRGYWNDMNEIATWGQALPELIEFGFEGNKTTAREGRNIYGMLMAKSTFEAAKQGLKGKRPFNLTRAGFSGVQRYAAVWTGDNVASDEHMMAGVRLVNSMGLAGIAFTGYDIGGFIGNASEKLFARWISIGAFSPFFRGHSMINSRDSEPWTYGEEVEDIARNYINLRYRLIPYLYATFYEASRTGMPISRSLAINYTFDDKIYWEQYQNQYLFGDSIMVAPVESDKEIAKVYFPEGNWYDLFTGTKYQGSSETFVECPKEKLPVFVKESAIIPMREVTQSLKDNTPSLLELHVYEGNIENHFTYFEDDGETYSFKEGAYYKRNISYSPSEKQIALDASEGSFKSKYTSIRVYFHGFDNHTEKITVNGNKVLVKYEDYRFVLPISNFDPYGHVDDGRLVVKDLQYIELENSNDRLAIEW